MTLALMLALAVAAPAGHPARANGWEHGAVSFQALVDSLTVDQAATRRQAAQSLGYRGQPEAVPPLIDALRRPEPDPGVRGAIYRALGALGAVQALPVFARCLEEETRMELRGDCAAALGGLAGGPKAAKARDRLFALLAGDAGILVKSRAVDALGAFSDRRAVAALARIAGAPLDDPPDGLPGSLPARNASLAQRAVPALGATGHPAAGPVLARLLEEADGPRAQLRIVKALIPLGTPAAKPVLERLLTESADQRLRIAATVALAGIGDGDVRPRLEALLDEGTPAVQLAAIEALRRLGAQASAPRLADYAAGHVDWYAAADADDLMADTTRTIARLSLMEAAFRALIALDATAGDRLMARVVPGRDLDLSGADALAVADAVYRVRRAALYGLGYSDEPDLAGPVLAGEHGLGADDPRLRAVAARALGVLGRADAVRRLVVMLEDPAAEVRWTAAQTLGLLGNMAAMEPLVGLFDDPDSRVRAKAATALADLEATAAIPVLERRVATEERPPARRAAEAALDRLRAAASDAQ